MTEALHTSISFGAILRRYRERAGLSQEALAERAGLTSQAISALERGERRHPYPATVGRLADALQLSKGDRADLAAAVPPRGRVLEVVFSDGSPSPSHGEDTVGPLFSRLPTPLTPLLGREEVVAQVVDLLQQGTRLLTLTGPGGVGKTRLALQVASSRGTHSVDGVVYVPLATLADDELVLPTIAQALRVQEIGGRPLVDLIGRALRGTHLLVVLDNCEHVLTGVTQVAALLERCPQLVVLATSREPLRVRGEHEYPVQPLALPPFDHALTPEDAASSPAVALFVQTARAARQNITLTEDNAATIAEICRRLDGLPLAIELAAARVRLLPPSALLARLSDRLGVLTGGSRDLPTRHQTLRGTIDWSYALLDPEEQRLFARMGVFAGGCTLEAAEAVCALSDDAKASVLEELESLVDKNLLHMRDLVGGEPRLVQLGTITEYARERLRTNGEAETLHRRHAEHFLELAEAIEREDRGAASMESAMRLEADHDNLRVALQWALDRRDVELGLRLAATLGRFWELRGHLREGQRWLRDFLALDEQRGKGTPAIRAKALSRAAHLAYVLNQATEATTLFERCLPLHRALEDKRSLAEALVCLGELATWQGNPEQAVGWREEHLALARESGDTAEIAQALLDLAEVVRWQGNLPRLQSLGEEALALYRDLDDQSGVVGALQMLGHIAQNQGDPATARAIFDECVSLLHRPGTGAEIRPQLESLALTARSRGWYQQSTELFEESMGRSLELGDRRGAARTRCEVGRSAHEQGEYERATTLLEDSLAEFRDMGDLGGIGFAMLDLSQVAIDLGDAERAVELSTGAREMFRDLGDRGQVAHSLLALGMAIWLQGDPQQAADLLEESLTALRAHGHRAPVAQVLTSIGFVALDQGDTRRAESAFGESLVTMGVGASRRLLARNLEGMGGVAVGLGYPERATRLFAAADALRVAIDVPVAPAFRASHVERVAAAREAVGETQWSALEDEGRSMTVTQALALALQTTAVERR